MALTLAEANWIMEGAIAHAQELNIKINVAVCDAGGRLVAFNRMDGAIWAGVYGSQGKAVASAGFGRPSGELAERANQPTPSGIREAEGGHMIMGQGGLPIAPQRGGRRGLRSGWRYLPGGRRLLQGRNSQTVGP